ncbi:hypothetical protein [uncultured Metabacillus sp.]|uniref:hypothetical protein n=1 Tax=uncultured Metabacillus sp. TaxID=2860135 RepID=UPI00262552A3|nr:hypothetical protein [uncultured Metabacillus sp.]
MAVIVFGVGGADTKDNLLLRYYEMICFESSFFSLFVYMISKRKGGFYMNDTTEKIVHTNLRFCPQCNKERPYVIIYVTGSIRCANCDYYHLKQSE